MKMSPKISKHRKIIVFSPNLLIFSKNFVALVRNIYFIAIFSDQPVSLFTFSGVKSNYLFIIKILLFWYILKV